MTKGSSSGSQPSNRIVMIVLSYLWILALVPLLLEKHDTDIQWHAKHGLVLLAAEIIFWIAYSVVITVLSFITSGLGYVLSLFAPFLWMAIVILHVVAIIKGLNDDRLIIPGVSEYVNRF